MDAGFLFCFELAVKGAVLSLLAGLVWMGCIRASAARRHFAVHLFLGAAASLPLLLSLPHLWRMELLPVPSGNPASMTTGSFVSWQSLLFLVWLAGFSWRLLRLVAGLFDLRALVRRGQPPQDLRWIHLVRRAAHRLGLNKPVRLLVSSETHVALAAGVFQSVVLLPRSARFWPPSRLEMTLLHELAHVRRRDGLSNLLAQLALAIHWFNPVVVFAVNRLRVERERACDDEVLGTGVPPIDYCEHLLELILAGWWRESLPSSVLLSERSTIKDRILAIIDSDVPRKRLMPRQAAAGFLLVAGFLLPLATLHPWILEPLTGTLGFLARSGAVTLDAMSPRPLPPISLEFAHPDSSTVSESISNETSRTPPMEGRGTWIRAVDPKRVTSIPSRLWSTSGQEILPWNTRDWTPLEAVGTLPETVRRTAWLRHGAPAPSTGAGPEDPPPEVPPEAPPEDSSGTPSPATEPSLQRVRLGTLGGDVSSAAAISDNGLVVGTSSTLSGEMHAYLWSPESGMLDLGNPGESSNLEAVDVNDLGQTLFSGRDGNGFRRTYFWSPDLGTVDLGTLGGDYTNGLVLNNRGEVAGTSQGRYGAPRAFYWSLETGIIDLGGDRAVDLNDGGEVVAQSGVFSYLWSRERGFELIGEPGWQVGALAINNHGQVVGAARRFGDRHAIAFLWGREEGFLNLSALAPDVPFTVAFGINDRGQVVGAGSIQGAADRALVWSAEQGVLELDFPGSTLRGFTNTGLTVFQNRIAIGGGDISGAEAIWLSLGDGLEDGYAEAIDVNDQGEVVGNLVIDHKRQAVVWQLDLGERGTVGRWQLPNLVFGKD